MAVAIQQSRNKGHQMDGMTCTVCGKSTPETFRSSCPGYDSDDAQEYRARRQSQLDAIYKKSKDRLIEETQRKSIAEEEKSGDSTGNPRNEPSFWDRLRRKRS